jgi:hypothetical protein
MMKQIRISAWMMMGYAMCAWAGLDLHSFICGSTVTLPNGEPRQKVYTSIDTVMLDAKIDHGVAVTQATLVVRPRSYKSAYAVDGAQYWASQDLDSLEIICDFSLPPDFAVTRLFLWVNGQRQEGFIQRRDLANQQYESIVNHHRDPSVLNYDGKGKYQLRIYPASSNQQRKVAIVVQHTLDNTVDSIAAAVLPFTFDIAKARFCDPVEDNKPIGFMSASFTASDSFTYAVTIPGLGGGVFSWQKELALRGECLFRLGAGEITAPNPFGRSHEFVWMGRDRDSLPVFGFHEQLSDSTVALEPEPRTRVIIIDLRARYIELIKKLAVLCLHDYLDTSSLFNLAIAGKAEDDTRMLFDVPMPLTSRNLDSAYRAIVACIPLADASTVCALRKVVQQAKKQLFIVISDLDAISSDDQAISAAGTLLDSSESMLFTMSDNQMLAQLAGKSGGCRLATLSGSQYYDFHVYYTPDGKKRYEPKLPDLFPAGLDAAVNQVAIVAVDNISDVCYTYQSDQTGLGLWVAGRFIRNNGVYGMFVKGRIGGRCFLNTIAGAVPDLPVDSADPAALWAFRKAEQLTDQDSTHNAGLITTIGMDYHVVSRYTSLLALEPGMLLWKGTAAPVRYAESPAPSVVLSFRDDAGVYVNAYDTLSGAALIWRPSGPSEPVYTIKSGDNLANVSLDQLISGPAQANVVKNSNPAARSDFSVRSIGSSFEIGLPRSLDVRRIELEIFDIGGRCIASRVVPNAVSDVVRWNAAGSLTAGSYVLQIRAGPVIRSLRCLIDRKSP